MKRIFRAMFIVAVLCGIAWAGYSVFSKNGAEGPGYKLVSVSRGDITEKAVAVGQVEPRQQFHVKSKIPGIVKRCMVDVGDRVSVGDPLFEIAPDPTPFELSEVDRSVESAKAAFHKAKADHARVEELVGKGILAQADLDASRAEFDRAKIALDRAMDSWALTRSGRIQGAGQEMESIIRAPAAGTVLERSVDPGDPVVPLTSYQAGTELAVVADMDDLIFKGTVDEIDVGKLNVGFAARLKVGAMPDVSVTGRLNRIAPKAREEDNARLFDVEIELNPAEELVLRAGYSATADVVIREQRDTLLIPERLLMFEGQEHQTFVEIPNQMPEGEPVKVAVITGLSDGLNIEVKDGLQEGDQVVERPPREI